MRKARLQRACYEAAERAPAHAHGTAEGISIHPGQSSAAKREPASDYDSRVFLESPGHHLFQHLPLQNQLSHGTFALVQQSFLDYVISRLPMLLLLILLFRYECSDYAVQVHRQAVLHSIQLTCSLLRLAFLFGAKCSRCRPLADGESVRQKCCLIDPGDVTFLFFGAKSRQGFSPGFASWSSSGSAHSRPPAASRNGGPMCACSC